MLFVFAKNTKTATNWNTTFGGQNYFFVVWFISNEKKITKIFFIAPEMKVLLLYRHKTIEETKK